MSRFAHRSISAAVLTALGCSLLAIGSPAQAADTTPAKPAYTLQVRDSKLGQILTDDVGMTFYMFTPDRRNVSNCEGGCLAAWPPFMLKAGETLSDVALPTSLRRSQLGVAMRFDGSRQVTYSGWPLYWWARDKVAGDVTGQWVGGNWFVLNADGAPNTAPRP
jgi:predicted lipoprotein with Yx(FWY)xxD motif